MDVICSNNLFINDDRTLKDFAQTLFGGYAKTEVLTLLQKKIIEGHYESACYLSYQLLVSGHLIPLWEKLTLVAYKFVRNPRMIKWIYYKNKIITGLYSKHYSRSGEQLHLRNSQLVRNIITECVILLTSTIKKDKIELLKRKPKAGRDFEINRVYDELKHKGQYMITNITGPKDPREVCYIANELAHCLNNKNIQKALYWIEWLQQWEKQNIVKFKKFEVQSREINGIDVKYQRNIIWLIWCVILYIKNLHTERLKVFYGSNAFELLDEILDYIWLAYLYEWKPVVRAKRMVLIHLYINYMLNPQDLSLSITSLEPKEFVKVVMLIQEKLFVKIKAQSQLNSGMHFMMNYIPSGTVNNSK